MAEPIKCPYLHSTWMSEWVSVHLALIRGERKSPMANTTEKSSISLLGASLLSSSEFTRPSERKYATRIICKWARWKFQAAAAAAYVRDPVANLRFASRKLLIWIDAERTYIVWCDESEHILVLQNAKKVNNGECEQESWVSTWFLVLGSLSAPRMDLFSQRAAFYLTKLRH
jgi:hypothetical protein